MCDRFVYFPLHFNSEGRVWERLTAEESILIRYKIKSLLSEARLFSVFLRPE